MTTKRFTTKNGVFYTDTKTGYEFQCYGEVVNIMNELAEENQHLKKNIKKINDMNNLIKNTIDKKIAVLTDAKIKSFQNGDEELFMKIKFALQVLRELKKEVNKENEELKQTADKKQKHIVHLENKIHRMRKQIKKLEDLFHYRTADIDRQYSKRIGIYEDFLKENDLSINWSEYCDCDDCDVMEFIECKDCFHLMRVLNK